MTTGILSTDEGVASSAGGTASLRIAVLDRDSGFIQVLGKRMDRLGWEHRVLASPVPADGDRLDAPQRARRGSGGARTAGLGMAGAPVRRAARARDRRLHGTLDRCPAGARAAPGSRRLDHQALPPRGGDRARPRARPPPPSRHRADRVKAVSAGEVEIRSDRFQAFVAGRSLELTRREFELIELLAGGEGRVLEREEIYSRLWGYAMVRGDRSVDVFVRKLRQKLEKASPEWRYIHTHFGIGYRFAAERGDGADAEDCPRAAPREQDSAERLRHRRRARSPATARPGDQGKLGGAQQRVRAQRHRRLAVRRRGHPSSGPRDRR